MSWNGTPEPKIDDTPTVSPRWLFGPSYGRGRSSRENWKRSSLDAREDRKETRLPFTACEWLCSRPLALRPHVSTSNVPFFCSDQV